MAKKLTTSEILAAARAQAAGSVPEQDEAVVTETGDVAAGSEDGGDGTVSAAQGTGSVSAGGDSAGSAAPKSTRDILAAARAQAAGKPGGGEREKSASTPSATKPSSAPKSTTDILAAARAQAQGEKAASTGRPSSPQVKGGSQKPTVSEPTGEKPSVQEMLKAVREGKPSVPDAAVKPSRLPVPQKPPAAVGPAGKKVRAKQPRRNVLVALVATPFAFAWTMFAASTAVFSAAIARFMMPNVLVEPPSKFKVGPPSNYPQGTVATKWKSQFAVWIVHHEYAGKDIVYALKSVCTHLGCTPNWLEGEQKFKCPCHGSGFYVTGINFEGPAPRPLERYGIRVAPDGMLEIDKSVTFHQEKGQWSETASYVDTATV